MEVEPKTRRGRESRDRIVEHAAELIAEHGVDHFSLDDVRTAAGASKSQLYHYFSDREALVEAAVARRCHGVHVQLTQAFAELESIDELEGRLEGFVVLYEQDFAGCPLGTIAVDVADYNEGARRQVATAFTAWGAIFADLFARLRDRGELRPDADPAHLGTALLAALEGGQLLSQTHKDATPLRIAIAAALGYARTFAA
jgi:TetR/AcrR family transcriptional regulator, transcriptional repressor for nem operon